MSNPHPTYQGKRPGLRRSFGRFAVGERGAQSGGPAAFRPIGPQIDCQKGMERDKELTEMSLEELWRLFPVILVAHREQWKRSYDAIETYLKKGLAECPIVRISHIGSTAVAAIRAKDIVDVLVEAAPDAELAASAAAIERIGFVRMSATADRISFNRGYTKQGFAEKVFHVHLRRAGDNDELYFRDYLNACPRVARAYEALKLRLQVRFMYDRDAYTAGKTAFVRRWTAVAKKVYAGRY